MGIGYLKIQARTAGGILPVANAQVTVTAQDGRVVFQTETDANGNTSECPLPAPDKALTLDSKYLQPAYSIWDVDVEEEGFASEHIHAVEIEDASTAILPVMMEPLVDEQEPVTDVDTYIPPIGLLIPAQNRKITAPARTLRDVIIPDYITVHLGTPTNASARNVRVSFVDYVKNVTSSEIYATWPYNSLVANIHAITTFALNRVYTEWYRSRGFNFDITNSTSYDQYYRDGAQIFDNISKIVDNIFNVYARRAGFRNPFFTSFCNGTTATCAGLSQWGTVALANQGRTPLQILHYYYPNDLQLVASNNITGITESYPGYTLQVGSQGEAVRRMQNHLNRIRVNFPLIPQISNPNGTFDTNTQNAVRVFQQTFNLTADGVIGRATWNKISFIFVGVTRLAELDSEGERYTIGNNPPNVVLSLGSRGADVLELQFILNVVAQYYSTVPPVIQDSVFDASVKNAVMEFQRTFRLFPDGVVGPATWNKLYAVYRGIHGDAAIPPDDITPPGEKPDNQDVPPYPGVPLRLGSTGADVKLMQTYLNTIRAVYTSIPPLVVDGIFGEKTQDAVIAFQNKFLLEPDGIIGRATWEYIVLQYRLVTGAASVSLDYPGTPLKLGSTGSNVLLMQQFLSELRAPYPSLPLIKVDGIFGPNTQAAVTGFQRLFGLAPDGIIGPITWDAIIRERNAAV